MFKEKKFLIIITSAAIMLPAIFGLIFWNQLPSEMATHWNASGDVDGWSSKTFAVLCLPAILLGVHLLCIAMTAIDPKHKNHGSKILNLILWICPILSVACCGATYAHAFGVEMDANRFMPVVVGIMFIVIGNYLPKCKQNYTIGIKLPWTLNNEEVWNRTHRLCGRLWVVGGIVITMSAFLPDESMVAIVISVLVILIAVPVIYSWQLHKKLS